MEKFSVKKPFTVLVGVIMVLLLGFVALSHMQTNLLPDISTPYLMVVTVYPGASPERVESEVADVMENALGTVTGVDTITSTSAENYNLLLLKFSEGTDMNSTMVKVSNKVDQTVASLPDTCLTPSILEYSLNMNAFMTVAVSREGSDVYDLSSFVSDTLVPYVERKGGVSSVSANGLIEKMVQVQLNQKKIDVINEKLLETIDTQLAAAHEKLEEAQAQINAGRAEYEKQMKKYGDTVSDTVMAQMGTEVGSAVESVKNQAQDLLNSINELIEIVNDPDIKQSLVDIRDGLQNVVEGSAMKTAAVGSAAGYVAWQNLVNDKSMVEIASDVVVGKDTTEKISEAVEDVKGLKNKAGEAVDAVNGAMGDINSKWSGMSNFFRGIFGGNGLEMFGNFFKNLGKGNVSGLSLAGLVTAAFLTFGRFGWLGKIAGAMLGMMLIGNNSNIKNIVSGDGGQGRNVNEAETTTRSGGMKR